MLLFNVATGLALALTVSSSPDVGAEWVPASAGMTESSAGMTIRVARVAADGGWRGSDGGWCGDRLLPGRGGRVGSRLRGNDGSGAGVAVGGAGMTESGAEPIRVLSADYTIDFPNHVVLTVEAESQSVITGVTLHYKLGGRPVRAYGYPDFRPGNRVSADFVIETGGGRFLPSGVDIEYHYVIEDAEGNSVHSPGFSLEYKDPSYEWHRYRQGVLEVLWHDRPKSTVVAVANRVSERLESVRRLLGLTDVGPMKAVIVNGPREARRSFPVVSRTATAGHLYGGFAFGDLDVFVLGGLGVDGMVHEMTHLLIDEALSSPWARIPAWLNEGLAMYFESGSQGRASTVERAARRGELVPFRSMESVPGRPDDVRLFYAQSWSFVDHLMTAHGERRMSDLLAALADGEDIRRAVIDVYGTTLEGLEEEWKAGIPGAEPSGPTTNPGVWGTSAIITGAVSVAVAAGLLRWVRGAMKHDRDPGN